MRTRWLVLLLAVSGAANVALGVALLVSWQGGRPPATALGRLCSAPLCEEEMKVREELAASLCSPTPDRAAIGAALGRLDEVRARQRAVIVERWLSRCCSAGAGERAALAAAVKGMLCPWQGGSGAACCVPSPGPAAHSDTQPQHGQM